jgi:hypothetical protein
MAIRFDGGASKDSVVDAEQTRRRCARRPFRRHATGTSVGAVSGDIGGAEKLFESNWKTGAVRPASKTPATTRAGRAWNNRFVMALMPTAVTEILSSPPCAIMDAIICGCATFEIPFH